MHLRPRLNVRLIVFSLICLVTLTGFGCRRSDSTSTEEKHDLVIWGLWQESNHMGSVLKSFEEQYGIKASYRKVASVATYEKELVEAIAEGRGPDVFVMHHTWVDNKQRLITPAPADIIDLRALQDEFVDVVATDVVRDGKIMALPTSVDTLAMYYNKDILNAAGIAKPPTTWTEFQQLVERITTVNRVGTIDQSAAALGTAANINRAPDLLQLLFLQSGIPIQEPGTTSVQLTGEIAERALTFYTDFSNRTKRVYTWNLQQDFSIDAFAEGDTAVMFNYSYHIPTVRAKNPRLNFAIAPMPQIAGSTPDKYVNFAAYWPFTVSNASPSPRNAWLLVRHLTGAASASTVNAAQGVPPARRDSVLELQRDPIMGVFAEQTLTAKSWPRYDLAATDTIMNTMIDSVVTGATTIGDALQRAQDQVNQVAKQ